MNYRIVLKITPLQLDVQVTDENEVMTSQIYRCESSFQDALKSLPILQAISVINGQLQAAIAKIPAGGKIKDLHVHTTIDEWFVLDELFNPIHTLLDGSDQRAKKYVEAGRANGIIAQLEAKSGAMITYNSPIAMLLWLKNEVGTTYQSIKHIMSFRDYLIYTWTGANQTVASTAARSGMYNMSTNNWDGQALAFLDLQPEQLPAVVHDKTVKADFNSEIAHALGLNIDTKIVW